MKNAWLEKVMRKNENSMECMKEENIINNEDKIVILKEGAELKNKEIKKMKGIVEGVEELKVQPELKLKVQATQWKSGSN